MKKAFLFDMDGVIVNSEQAWGKYGMQFLEELYGKDVLKKIGDLTGTSLDNEYKAARNYGFTMDLKEYYKKYDEQAAKIYSLSKITGGLVNLIQFLKKNNFITGIVSSSRRPWIEIVLDKIGDRELFDYTLSLNEEHIASKPSPDGYIRVMKELGVVPRHTIVLEDSNNGIKSAKASGAFVIGFPPLLAEGYSQKISVDAVANSFEEVIEVLKSNFLE